MRRMIQAAAVLFALLITPTASGLTRASATTPVTLGIPPGQWYMVETHVHSTFSADAVADIGVLAATARALGYDAVFLTDHNEGSSFQIARQDANWRALDEDSAGWGIARFGEFTQFTAGLDNSLAYQGTRALHVKGTSPSVGTLSVWTRRGPLIAAGPVTLQFALRALQVSPQVGFAFLISLGGDPTVGKVIGYTNQDGTVLLGQGVTFAWTIGEPELQLTKGLSRSSGQNLNTNGNYRILRFPLPTPEPDRWTIYTIDITEALTHLPIEQQPHLYSAFLYPRFVFSARGGTSEFWLDDVQLRAQNPLPPAQEFVARTQLCRATSDASFQLLCAHEMGQQHHVIRFDFDITEENQFEAFPFGTAGIAAAHEAGYPAQLNHPGSTIRLREIRENRAFGADFLEVRKPEWARLWDELLHQDLSLLGSWGTDSHELIDPANPATFVYAPSLDRDALVHALYEGRSFLARNTFRGWFFLSPWPDISTPYPARYPIFVSNLAQQTTVWLHWEGDIPEGSRIRWIRNGQVTSEQPVSPSAHLLRYQLDLTEPLTILRAELVAPGDQVIALTQPLTFRDITGLPAHHRYLITSIQTLSGRHYNSQHTIGISAAAWDPSIQALLLTFKTPPGSLIHLVAESEEPTWFDFAGGAIGQPTNHEGRWSIRLRTPTSPSDLVIGFHPHLQPDRPAPEAPRELIASRVSLAGVNLRWEPSPNQDQPVRYRVYRNHLLLASVGPAAQFLDRSVQSGLRYSYSVVAEDLTGQASPASQPLSVTIPPPILLQEDFESNTLAGWTSAGTVLLQKQTGQPHNLVARLEAVSSPAFLQRAIPPQQALIVRFRLQLLDRTSGANTVVSFADDAGSTVLALQITTSGQLSLLRRASPVRADDTIMLNNWYDCTLHLANKRTPIGHCRSTDGGVITINGRYPIELTEHSISMMTFGESRETQHFVVLLDNIRVL